MKIEKQEAKAQVLEAFEENLAGLKAVAESKAYVIAFENGLGCKIINCGAGAVVCGLVHASQFVDEGEALCIAPIRNGLGEEAKVMVLGEAAKAEIAKIEKLIEEVKAA
jgi:hypothetical protein